MEIVIETAPDVFKRWNGEVVNGIRHPHNIRQLWTKEEIEAAGLFVPLAALAVPDGHRIVSDTVQRVDGVVQHVITTEEIPPKTPEEIEAELDAQADQILQTDRRLKAMMGVVFDMYDKLTAAGVAGFPALTDAQKRAYIKSKL